MKYSEFLQIVITTTKCYEDSGRPVYLCNVLGWEIVKERLSDQDKNVQKLFKTIQRKLDTYNEKFGEKSATFYPMMGYGSAKRIKWLESLIKLHQRKGN